MTRLALLLLFSMLTFTRCEVLKEVSETLPSGGGLTEAEAARGLKDALVQGATEGADIVSQVNGYFGNPSIKIFFPPEAQKIENTLRDLGMNKLCDDVIESLNRAAEDAAKEAAPIFVDAIKAMTIRDAMDILFGADNAATNYLKKTTTASLTEKFSPVIDRSLSEVNATKYWDEAVSAYNKIPLVQDLNPDLTGFVTEEALNGLFYMVEKEEKKIRENPLERTTGIMKKVFGYYDANK